MRESACETDFVAWFTLIPSGKTHLSIFIDKCNEQPYFEILSKPKVLEGYNVSPEKNDKVAAYKVR